MEPLVTDDLDPAATLAAAEAAVMERRAADVKDLLLALRWADLHGSDPQAEPGAIPVRYGGDRLVEIGGEGTPPVRDLCVHELAIARRCHSLAARSTMADALDLRHRLPRTWAQVQGLSCEPWVAGKVARMTRRLDRDRAALVDTAVADAIGGCSPGRVLALAEAKVIEADTAAHAARLEEARRARGVWVGETNAETGNRDVFARTDPADAAGVDVLLEQVVDVFRARPDLLRAHHRDLPAELDDLTHHELRALAFGWLARPEDLQALLSAAAQPGDGETTGRNSRQTGRQRAVIYLHLHESAVTGTTDGVARVEHHGPMILEQIVRLLGHARVTVKPVIDLDEHTRVDAYEFPTAVRERTRLRCGGDVFPHATNTSTITGRFDDDHPVAYDPTGPPGQTGDHNDAPLSRGHHRAKTHRRYRARQLDDGSYVWTSPHGLTRLVDPTGTHDLAASEAWRYEHAERIDAAIERLHEGQLAP